MLIRLSRSFAIAAFLTAVGATTTVTATAPAPTITTISQCPTGDAQCCNTVESIQSPGVTQLLGLLGIVVTDNTLLVGIACTPITVIGVGQGANCAQQPVCCINNDNNGIINIGCTPISL
ncbi:Hydrophobin [Mycena venus]|uniref:Hydrophobin n=1 Tax=Mycena venus TaxID=2733690 RepID=A0A8H7D2J1_9AGAR|nr:Hydrophobin [Mycena venus]